MVLAFLTHPILLTAFIAVAVGVTIYQIVSEQEERRQPIRRGPRSPSPPRSPPPRNGNQVKQNVNYIRNRKPNLRGANKEEENTTPNTKGSTGDNKILSDKSCDPKNCHETVRDEIESDTYNNENLEDDKNTSDEELFSFQNNLYVKFEETKLLNIPNQGYDKERNENVKSSPCNFVESDYKKAVLNKIKNDVTKEHSLCKACEIKIADSVCEPCGHCYMCSTCAISILRIYGQCAICHIAITSCELQKNTLA